jgi:tetratricopeptide (TPR) repeat protein
MGAGGERAEMLKDRRGRTKRPARSSTVTSSWPRWRWCVGGVFVAAAIWRLMYLGRLAGSPLRGSLRDDAQVYWSWAEHLLSVGPLGTSAFFFGPLYPYVLAGLRAVGVGSIDSVLVVQALWGAASAAFLADAARRLTGPRIGLAIGLLVAGYEPAVFFDGLILSESLQFFLECVLLWWVVRQDWTRVDWRACAITGGLIGLCAESRATSCLLVLPAVTVLRPIGAWQSSPFLRRSAALGAGFLLIAAPVAVRNFAVGGEWIPFTYNLGFNLYVGNNPRADGSYVHLTGSDRSEPIELKGTDFAKLDGRDYLKRIEHLTLTPAGSSRYWSMKARSYVDAHPARALALGARKLGMLWNRREYAQIENIDEFRKVAGPLGWPWLGSFAVLGPFALAGAWFARKRSAPVTFVTGYVLVMTLVIVPFFVVDRYRHHLVPGAALLAALALEQIWAAVTKPRRVGRLATAGALLSGFAVVFLPLPGVDAHRTRLLMESDLGTRWLEHGRADRAAAEFEKALSQLDEMSRGGAAIALLPGEGADIAANYGRALEQLDRNAEAAMWLERSNALVPDRPSVMRDLAAAYSASGRGARADSMYARLPQSAEGQATLDVQRGSAAAQAGRLDEAERLFSKAVEQQSDLIAGWAALIRVQVQSGRLEDARRTLGRAQAAGIPRAASRAYEALLAVLSGDADAAERALAEVPPDALSSDQTLADVVRIVRERLKRLR